MEKNKYEEWIKKEIAKLKDKDKNAFLNDLLTGGIMLKVNENGDIERLVPNTSEWWKAKEKLNNGRTE
jgi:hypothetical protein